MHALAGILLGGVVLLNHLLGSSPKDTRIGRGWYRKFWFWDEMNHTLAGLSLGLFGHGLLSALDVPAVWILPMILFVALAWEYYEVVAWDMREKMSEGRWRHDTLGDIAYVMTGAQAVLIALELL